MQHLGQISQDDLDSVVDSDDLRAELRKAYDAAATEVGQKRALKETLKTASMFAEVVSSGSFGVVRG